MDIQQQILAYLGTQTEATPTLAIAKAVFGKKGTKKQVNPALYALARLNKVCKETTGENGTNPRWRRGVSAPLTSSLSDGGGGGGDDDDGSVFVELGAMCVDADLEDRGLETKPRYLKVTVRFPDKATLDHTSDTLGGDDWIASFEVGLDDIGKSTWRIDDVIEVNKLVSREVASLFGYVDYIKKT